MEELRRKYGELEQREEAAGRGEVGNGGVVREEARGNGVGTERERQRKEERETRERRNKQEEQIRRKELELERMEQGVKRQERELFRECDKKEIQGVVVGEETWESESSKPFLSL